MVGSVPVGGEAPISVQTMTNSLTSDIDGTLVQINAAAAAGADIVRVSCPDEDSTAALKTICAQSPVPIVADIHFHYRRAIEAAKAGALPVCASTLAILAMRRGFGRWFRRRVIMDVQCVLVLMPDLWKSIFLKNMPSLALKRLSNLPWNMPRFCRIMIFTNSKFRSKHQMCFLAVAAYQQLADVIDCPLHIGITEAGGLRAGTIKSAIGLGNLLWAGIGDTVRVSLSADPTEEVKAGYEMLKSLGLRRRGVTVISCPSCAHASNLTLSKLCKSSKTGWNILICRSPFRSLAVL